MKRIIYKVSYANSDDFQKGQYHFSPAFEKLSDAKKFEKKLNESDSEMNARIELRHEVYERYDWLPDWDMGDDWLEIVD